MVPVEDAGATAAAGITTGADLTEAVEVVRAGGSGLDAGVREAVFGDSAGGPDDSPPAGGWLVASESAGTITRLASDDCSAFCAEGLGAVGWDFGIS